MGRLFYMDKWVIVGATIGRPPKNGVFRISRREITIVSPCGEGILLCKIRGRPRVAPTESDPFTGTFFGYRSNQKLPHHRNFPDQGGGCGADEIHQQRHRRDRPADVPCEGVELHIVQVLDQQGVA